VTTDHDVERQNRQHWDGRQYMCLKEIMSRFNKVRQDSGYGYEKKVDYGQGCLMR
jgi:hypothetical protein